MFSVQIYCINGPQRSKQKTKLVNISNIRSSNPTTKQCAKFDQRKNKDTKPTLRVSELSDFRFD